MNSFSWKKGLCIACIAFAAFAVQGQSFLLTDKGKISFVSNAPLEIIKAASDQVKVAINPATNQFAFSVVIQSFKGFNSGLQREHFNEKYMESERYPTATFKGKIIEKVDYTTDGTYEVRAKGELEMHGVKQTRIIKSKVIVRNGKIGMLADFIIPLSDHNIPVPRVSSEKIATEIAVSVSAGETH